MKLEQISLTYVYVFFPSQSEALVIKEREYQELKSKKNSREISVLKEELTKLKNLLSFL